MSFALTVRNIPLSYFYSNGNGERKDIIACSSDNYVTFETQEQAEEHIKYMWKEATSKEITGHWNDSLRYSVLRYLSNFRVRVIE